MLVTRSVVYAALFLVVNFGCIAVMYLVLDAAFLFAVQIIVYTGAIMVLFLFVIMLLGVDRIEVRSEGLWLQRPIAIVLAGGFVLAGAAAAPTGIGVSTHAPDGVDPWAPGRHAPAGPPGSFSHTIFPRAG